MLTDLYVPLILPTTVYIDESGFTGDDLLRVEQPYFVLAGVTGEQEFFAEFMDQVRREIRSPALEIKGKSYAAHSAFERSFRSLLGKLDGSCKFVIAQKQYVACSKFFEYAIEPGVSHNNAVLYKNDFHLFLANLIFMHIVAEQGNAFDLLQRFVAALRGGPDALDSFGKTLGPNPTGTSSPMQDVIAIARRTWFAAQEELEGRIGDAGRLKWVLDATTNAMASLMRDFSGPDRLLQAVYDSSKPMQESGGFFDIFVNRPDLTTLSGPFGRKPIGFNLAAPMRSADSKTELGIQVADVAAAIANKLAKENRLDREREVVEPLLSDECLFPDLGTVDLDRRSAMANAVVLRHMADGAETLVDLVGEVPFLYELAARFDPRKDAPSPEEMDAFLRSQM